MGIGNKGRIEVLEHFMGYSTESAQEALRLPQGKVNYCADSAASGVFALVTDEPGGILQITTDTTDNHGYAFSIGPFAPSDGGCAMEARFKVDAVDDLAVYCGFSETLAAAGPVMPAEFATESFIYNGTGGMAGLQFDADGTTDDWRACGGDAAAAAFDADSDATRANQAPVADEFDVIRVEINPHGDVDYWLADKKNGLRLIKHADSVVTATDVQFAVLMLESRANAAAVMEIDYMYASGGTDWTQ